MFDGTNPGEVLKSIVLSRGKERYAGRRFMGVEFVLDPAWPFASQPVYDEIGKWVATGRFTTDQALDAFWACLDQFDGNGYLAFVKTHDCGFSVSRYLDTGDPSMIIKAPPVDLRVAPLNDDIQFGFLERGLDMYGNPLPQRLLNQGASMWALFASGAISFATYGVRPEAAMWLLYNGHVTAPSDKFAWTPYRGKTITECVIILENIAHPGRKI